MSAAQEVVTEDALTLLERERRETERLREEVASLKSELERIGRASVLHLGETDCDVAQAGFNHLRALAARALTKN